MRTPLCLPLLFALSACHGRVAGIDDVPSVVDAALEDTTSSPPDTTPDTAPDTGPVTTGDGTPQRIACIHPDGTDVTNNTFGRLDGYLVSVVLPTQRGCNADPNHLHLQIRSLGHTYDVAVTLDSTLGSGNPQMYLDEIDHTMPDGAWSEGWHGGVAPNDYPTTFGAHSGDFTAMDLAPLAQHLESVLSSANHISVFATGYGPTGVHKVHRNLGGDGAIVIQPLATVPHVLLFRFDNDHF